MGKLLARRSRIVIAVLSSMILSGAYGVANANAAPAPVSTWYFFDCSTSTVASNSYADGKLFSQNNPGGTRLMLLDYGAARVVGTGFGTQTFCTSSAVYLTNTQILTALESAADGVHDGYTGTGSTIVAYGNNNSYMTSHGMSSTDAYNAGFYQSEKAQDLAGYQATHGYNKQSVAIGQDQEPGFDKAPISRSLTDGAANQGYALNYDFGSADGCYPYNGGVAGGSGSCSNGWTADDVGYVSYDGPAVPLPEIYYSSPDQAAQWTNINNSWGAGYEFWGTTGESGAQLTPAQGWTRLNNDNPGLVMTELICFGC
jgi:hypothetical protein